ncbi:MAG: urea ABC transporter permease subunit UrtB [Candidatus Tectomicrobia bacterium]|nr:urea ABC transporter permease subunit UrtB [Candidatus Tectomicrobia bacterium]
MRWIFLLSCLALSGLFTGQAGASSLEAYASNLATASKQHETLEQIRNLADPALKGLLQAIKEGALYSWQGKFLILTDDGTYTDLAGEPLLDASDQPIVPEDGVEQVPLDEINISFVQQALDFMNLFDKNPETRKLVARKLGNLQDASAIHLLEKALERESDPSVKSVMTEAVNKLRLSDPDPQVRIQVVAFFSQIWSESALAPLKTLLEKEQDRQVKKAIEGAISRIEQYIRIRTVIGYLFNGLSLASILLVMSLGLAITFRLMGIINMAHGEMLMLGAYTAYVLQEFFALHFPGYQDYSFFIALPLSLLVVGSVGLLLERGVLRFLYGRPLESLLITWGIGMILQQGARLYFGDQTSVNSPTWFRGGWEVMPGLLFPYSRIFIIALSLFCLLSVYLLLYRSNAGLKIRSVMQNRDMAACMGISTRKVDAFTFALGTALAGLAGCALSLIGTVDPEMGKTYIVDSFMVVVLGGVGKLLGTVLASFGIGMSNKILEPAIGGTASAVYAKVGILVLVILFLQLRPTGLFPAKERSGEAMVR